MSEREPSLSDGSDDEWAFLAPYLTLLREDAEPWEHSLRMLPDDLPPWHTVDQQARRWERAGCSAAIVDDRRRLLRLAAEREEQPTAVIFDRWTLPSSPESGTRASYDGAKRRRGSKVHRAVDTLGHLLARTSRRPMSRTSIRLASYPLCPSDYLLARFGPQSAMSRSEVAQAIATLRAVARFHQQTTPAYLGLNRKLCLSIDNRRRQLTAQRGYICAAARTSCESSTPPIPSRRT